MLEQLVLCFLNLTFQKNRLLDNRDLITTRLGSNSNFFSNECLMRFPVGVIKNLQY